MNRCRPVAPLLSLLMLAFALGGCSRPVAPIESLELADLQAPIMVQQLAVNLKRPHLVELPARPVNERFDLKLEDTDLAGALEAIGKLDPAFQVAQRGEVVAIWPASAADLKASPYSKKVASFHADGGAGDVLRRLLVDAGLADTTDLIVQRSGLRRPVKVAMDDVTVRDVFLEVAAQAHVGFFVEPGLINVAGVPE